MVQTWLARKIIQSSSLAAIVLLCIFIPMVTGQSGLVMTASIEQGTYSQGDPIMVNITLVNEGRGNVFTVMPDGGSFDIDYRFEDQEVLSFPAVSDLGPLTLSRDQSHKMSFDLARALWAREGAEGLLIEPGNYSITLKLVNSSASVQLSFIIAGGFELMMGTNRFNVEPELASMSWDIEPTTMSTYDDGERLYVLAGVEEDGLHYVHMAFSEDGKAFSPMVQIVRLGALEISSVKLFKERDDFYRLVVIQGTTDLKIATSTSTDLMTWSDPELLISDRILYSTEVVLLDDGRYIVPTWIANNEGSFDLKVLQTYAFDHLATSNEFTLFPRSDAHPEILVVQGLDYNLSLITTLSSNTYNGLYEFVRGSSGSWSTPESIIVPELTTAILFERRSAVAEYYWTMTSFGIGVGKAIGDVVDMISVRTQFLDPFHVEFDSNGDIAICHNDNGTATVTWMGIDSPVGSRETELDTTLTLEGEDEGWKFTEKWFFLFVVVAGASALLFWTLYEKKDEKKGKKGKKGKKKQESGSIFKQLAEWFEA